ncbi:MAG: ribosomal protein S18-alanine N-acetyltransferase [Candidatus Acidiferrum sp.]
MGVERSGQESISGVRRFCAEDADAVTAISNQSPEAANWSKESYRKLTEEDGSLALVVGRDGEIRGFLAGRLVTDQAEVLNLAVAAKHRRKGEGAALLAAALAEFGLRGVKNVYLEVRESNTAAIAFYAKQGFVKSGLRRGYYRSPDESAVTMMKVLE